MNASSIEQRISDLGLTLPAPLQLPRGIALPFPWVRTVGTRAIISGHGPTNADGSLARPLGFDRQPAVINGFTDLIVEVFGTEKGTHARSAVGMAELPFDIPVEIEGEVALFPE